MMGEFTLELREGGWVLRLEARTPADRNNEIVRLMEPQEP